MFHEQQVHSGLQSKAKCHSVIIIQAQGNDQRAWLVYKLINVPLDLTISNSIVTQVCQIKYRIKKHTTAHQHQIKRLKGSGSKFR